MKNKKLPIALFCILMLGLFVINAQTKKIKIHNAIESGINYIYESQLETGEISSIFCNNIDLTKECYNDENYFITASIIYSLEKVAEVSNNNSATTIIKAGVEFYKNNIPENDVWSYWPDSFIKIQPDVDDTSLISYILSNYGYNSNNIQVINNNRNNENLYYTWINDDGDLNNDIDSVVNTNVALYLNKDDVSSVVCNYLSSIIKHNTEDSSHWWYVDNYDLYYAMSRAYSKGIDCFADNKELIIQKITRSQKTNGIIGDNEFTTALSLNALLDFNYVNASFYNLSFKKLLETQQVDGGWPLSAYSGDPNRSRWFGSRSYVTAVALEAISKYYLEK